MYELHENEQYFFDSETLDRLTRFLSGFSAPCCFCAPLLGKHAVEAGLPVTILDIDERFADLPGFIRYDLYKPGYLDRKFDLILCDPPFFRVSLSQLFDAIRTLSHFNFEQPVMISYLRRRADAALGTFAPFALEPTGYCPVYQTVKKIERNETEFFSNLGSKTLAPLLDAESS